MEYYILKLYQSEKGKNPDVEQGFNRFQSKTKRIVIGCLVMMFISCIEMIVTMIIVPKELWSFIGVFLCIISIVIVVWLDNRDQKEHMEKYVDSHKKKINILCDLLSNEFKIDNREKIDELISVYQNYVDKKDKEGKSRNKIILTLFSAFAGVLSISFVNMDKIGIDFMGWLCLAVILLILVGWAGILIYFYTYFDPLKKKYESMIKDLRDLQLIKY